ncbi:hypothetical protein [Geodermatophilus sp. CPCC 206100]|uniref:hypothetical protein n=1 Tax=Geodermatophilus sp. CPCC 206100 TaxID=3020054 RepID=UPI003B0012D4
MRRELSNGEFDALGMGRLVGPDTRSYSRRTTRMERREVAALVESGCPVVTYHPGGQLVWHDEDDAWPAWADARTSLTTEAPDPRREGSVTAGRWECVDGSLLVVLLWHH